jgi:predicted nucleotidyltransferase
MTRNQAIVEITRRLVDYYQPERIYLFGSAARGDGGPDSDLDFYVILPDDAPPALYRPGVHRALWDVVRWPPSDFDMRAAQVKASLPDDRS